MNTTPDQQLRATQITVANLLYQKILDQLKSPNLSPRDLKSLTASFHEATRTLHQHDIVQQGWERIRLAREASERGKLRYRAVPAGRPDNSPGRSESPSAVLGTTAQNIVPLSAGGEGQGEVVPSSSAIGTVKSQIEDSSRGEVAPAPATSCSNPNSGSSLLPSRASVQKSGPAVSSSAASVSSATSCSNPDSGSSSSPSLTSVKSTPAVPPLATDHGPLTTLESLGISPETFNAKVDEILTRTNAADMTRNSAARNAHKELEHELRFKAMDAGTHLTYDQYLALKLEAGMDPQQAEIISHRQIVTDQNLLEKRQQRKASQAAHLAKAA